MAKGDLLKQAKADWKIAEDYWSDNRKKWLEDSRFCISGNQWPEKLKREREAQDLPCIEADKLNQYVRQVVNDGRQNRPGIKVRPVDDSGDEKAAAAFQGVIYDICDKSNADEAYDTALEHAARGGFGFFRVLSQYVHEKTFEQELVVRRVRNPLSAMVGPHQLADGSDADFGFCIDDVPKTRYKDQYPQAKFVDWTNDGFKDGWASEHSVMVCEYYYKVKTKALLHLLEDGTCVTDDEYRKAKSEGGKLVPIKETRQIPTYEVKWARISGCEVLEENKWLGKYIPIIPVYGNESDIEGKVILSGLIRGAKDGQMLHNYSRTKFAERVALTPQAPWVVAEESIDGHPEWAEANSGKHQALTYRAYTDDGQPIPPPQRINPTDIPAGFAQDAQMAEHDIQASMGMYAASLGQQSNEKSGKAIMARQREGDTSTFHYQDNLNRAIRYLARILVDAIPKYYDTKRVIRILGEDGKASMARLDPESQDASNTRGEMPIYNLNVGRFDVTVAAGPSFNTKRQESAEAMIALSQANPTMWQTHGDLIVESQDWPNADKFATRSRMALPPPIQQAMQQEAAEGPQSPEARQIMVQAEQALAQKDQQIQAAEAGIAERDQALQEADAAKVKAEMSAQQAKMDAASAELEYTRKELANERALMQAKYNELAAKLELKAAQTMQMVPPVMPPGPDAPAIEPGDFPPITAEDEPPPGGFFTPEGV